MDIRNDTNLHKIVGKSVVERDDERYKRYRAEWDDNPILHKVAPFPLHIDLEPTARCNLKCTFCATTYQNYKGGFMEERIWRAVLDECGKEGLYSLKFTFRGEPLLHPQIIKMVKYAKDVGIMDVYMNTNATLLNDKKAIALIEAGLDRISFSVEGYTAGVYEKYRIGSNFSKVYQTIAKFKELRDAHGKKPYIRIQSVRVPEMVGREHIYATVWSPYAEEVAVLDMKNERPDAKRDNKTRWGCPFLWQRMSITWDGKILPCCHDIRELMVLGSIGETTIKEAWNSKRETTYRNFHIEGNSHIIDSCQLCSLRDTEIGKLV